LQMQRSEENYIVELSLNLIEWLKPLL
jgi:hypothetical protein